MRKEELRLGNWVYMFGLKAKVKTIDKDIEELGIEPIQLTEEILLKCGFKKLGKYTFICDKALMQLEIDVVTNRLLHSILAIDIKHLHQLQNLYFALTNEELKINL